MNQKTAVVTGGTKGIGFQVVKDLLARNYYVFTNYAKDVVSAEKASDEFSHITDTFKIIRADQGDKEQFVNFIDLIKENGNGVHCIVCNAGITLRKTMTEITGSELERIMRVNVTSHFSLIRDLYPCIKDDSRIVFIGSVLGSFPHAASLAYGVSKAALHALGKNLVKEFENTKTTVNIVAPGFTETEWQKEKPSEVRENIYKKTAAKRFADAEEISQAVMFCLDNPYVNGSLIEINGGYCYK